MQGSVSRKKRERTDGKANDKCPEEAPLCCHCLDGAAEEGRELSRVSTSFSDFPLLWGRTEVLISASKEGPV